MGRVLVALVALLALAGCVAVDATEDNGPVGPARLHVTPVYPWRIAPADRAKTTTGSGACGSTESHECEGGACLPPAPK